MARASGGNSILNLLVKVLIAHSKITPHKHKGARVQLFCTYGLLSDSIRSHVTWNGCSNQPCGLLTQNIRSVGDNRTISNLYVGIEKTSFGFGFDIFWLPQIKRNVKFVTEFKISQMLIVPCINCFANKHDIFVNCHNLLQSFA